jgi:hypothetical protein
MEGDWGNGIVGGVRAAVWFREVIVGFEGMVDEVTVLFVVEG